MKQPWKSWYQRPQGGKLVIRKQEITRDHRDAQVEKKRAQTAYHRRETSPDVVLNDRELMGESDDYKTALLRMNQRKEKRQQEKRHMLSEKIDAYRTKEMKTIEMFKELAAKQQQQQQQQQRK